MEEDGYYDGWVNRIGMDVLDRPGNVSHFVLLIFLCLFFQFHYGTASHLLIAPYHLHDMADISICSADCQQF